MKEKYRWMSYETGEIQPNLWEVIKSTVSVFIHYGICNMKWRYNKEGY